MIKNFFLRNMINVTIMYFMGLTLLFAGTKQISANTKTKKIAVIKEEPIIPLKDDYIVNITDPVFLNIIRKIADVPNGYIYVKNIKQIDSLDLNNKGIQSIDGIECFQYLRHLNLTGNKITSIKPLEKMSKLEVLGLSKNPIHKDSLKLISKFRQLKELYLMNVDLDNNLVFLAELLSLQTLNISNANVEDIAPLGQLINLQNLYVDKNKITNINPICGLKQMEILYLNDNKIKDITCLNKMVNIMSLGLSKNEIESIDPLSVMQNLTSLDIEKTKIKDISPLFKCPNLWNLIMMHLEVPSQQVNKLKDLLPDLQIVK